MKYYLKERPVEIDEVDRNSDGSRFISRAGYIDGAQEDLTDDELDLLQEIYDDSPEINGYWG